DTMPEARDKLPGLRELFAPPSEVLAKAETERQRAEGGAPPRPGGVDDPRKDLVSAPPPAPGLFGGMRGTFDALPDVAQGNLTMLNTKADRFAPFVRRVGTRVFQNLLIYQRQNLEASDILAADDIVTARVTLDRSGKLKTLEVEDHSGSMAVDQTLIDALRQAAFDDNPPPSAANVNGEYEFVFQAQLIAGVGPGPRGPELRTVESRLRIGLL
ncbi:MAG: TonB C-terminal domain-containing protein, partial [Thermodesulfobacteriota bacterium]